jgi:hypothetical protein
MADRFPLIVNASSRKIEELVAGDNIDLTGNNIVIAGDSGNGKYLSSDGTAVFWNSPGDVYLTLAQTISNKTIENSIFDASINTIENIANTSLINSGITINGTTVALGGSISTPNSNTTYTTSAENGLTADQKIIRLTGSDGTSEDVTLSVGVPGTVPAGANPIVLNIARNGDQLTFTGTVTDNNTVTTLQASSGGTAQSGTISISGSGGATVTQNTATSTINIDTRNDDTVTRIRSGSGQIYSDGDFTFLGGTAVTVSQAGTATPGETEVTIDSSDTVTRVKGGASGTLQSGDITFSGGTQLGGNVTVQQTGSTIEIDSTDTDTVTKISSGTEVLASGDFKFVQAGATTITQTTDGSTGVTEIEIRSANTDTGASLSAGEGISLSANQFSLKNSSNLIDNRIPVWDDAQSQFSNGSITDDGSSVTIDGDLTVLGTNTILETSVLQVEDNQIELRRGVNLLGSDGGIQVNRTTDANSAITSYNVLQWFESGAYWRSYDGSVSNRFVTENEPQTLTQKILDGPTLINPQLGAAVATTYNGLSIDSTSGSTLDIADLKTITFNNTLGFLGTDGSSIDFDSGGGAGAKVAYDSFHLGKFALTTSTQLSGKIQDKSGSGQLVFHTNPIFVDSIGTQSNAFDLINTSALGINFGGVATQIEIGAATGTTSINHSLEVDGNTTLGDTNTDNHVVNGSCNFDTTDITIRGNDAAPISIGRGGGSVATNTRLGYAALASNQAGSQNTSMGYEALVTNVSGAANVAIGYRASKENDGGTDNVSLGKDAGLLNSSGDGNIAIGSSALENNPSSDYNVCIGHFAGNAITGIGNVVIGPADTQNSLSSTFPNNSIISSNGDRQLLIGSGTGYWLRGDASFNTTIGNDLQVDGDARILGDLIVEGATVSINSTTLTVDDKNIELANVSPTTIQANVSNGSANITNITPNQGLVIGMEVSSPAGAITTGTIITALNRATGTATLSSAVTSSSGTETFIVTGPVDTAADGGGLIIKGTPINAGGTGDKTILYDHSRTDKYFVSTESFELGTGKKYSIGNQLVLDSTTLGDGVVNSSLTSVGILIGATGQPALETDGAVVLGGRVIEEVFSSMATAFTISSSTASIITAAANTICGETTTANTAINTWAFSTADPDGNTLGNGQSITITLILDASAASTYGDNCSVDGNSISTGVRWSGGSPPIATSNTDILTFLIVKDSDGATRVYGQGNTDFS